MSLPHPKGIAHIRQEISRQITAGTIELGEAIVPRQYKKIDTISADGPIVQDCTVLGRKIPLFKIRSSILKRHRSNGWMRMPVGPNAGREELIQLVEKYCLPIDSSQTTEDLRVRSPLSCFFFNSYIFQQL